MVDNSTIKLNDAVRRFLACLMLLLSLCPSIYGQSKRALLVGISDYTTYSKSTRGQWGNIHGANDVELLAPTLQKKGFKVTKVTNKTATSQRIRKEIKKLVGQCRSGDIVYLHFSGHGQPFEDMNGDEEDGWDESFVPVDAQMLYRKGGYEGKNHLLDDDMYSYFQQIRKAIGPKGYLCVVIDACHAGGSSRGDELEEDEEPICRGTKKAFSPSGKVYRPRVNTNGRFTITTGSNLGNVTILEACRSYQSNYEIKQNGNYYGPLSYYVSQALQSNQIAPNLNLVNDVKRRMDGDRRLTRQNMVYETSLK